MRVLQRFSSAAVRRPVPALAALLALALVGTLAALSLRPSAATDTFVSAGSPVYRATADQNRHFGQDAIVVLVRAPVISLLAPAHLQTLSRLEACLDGQSLTASPTLRADVPAAAGHAAPYGGPASPCGALMRTHPVKIVYGPGTFLNRAVAAINAGVTSSLASLRRSIKRAGAAAFALARHRGASASVARVDAAAAEQAEAVSGLGGLEQLAAGVGLTGAPSIADATFLQRIVFGATGTTPQPRFAYLFPDRNAALIQVRLRADLSAPAQARALDEIRAAVRMPTFATGASYTVSGVPVVTADLAGTISGAIGALLAVAVLVMAGVLLVVFRGRPRLLPLLVALGAAGITFGLLAAAGVTLTLASVAVLPVLLGLAVDYGVQLQARLAEPGPGEGMPRDAAAIVAATARAAPALGAAALATLVGFLVVLLSPVPMVRGFAVVLAVGIAVALLVALCAVPAVLALVAGEGGAAGDWVRGAGELLVLAATPLRALGPALRGAGDLLVAGGRRLVGLGRRLGAIPGPRFWPRPRPRHRVRPRLRSRDRPRIRFRPARSTVSAAPAAGASARLERALGRLTARPGRVLALGLLLAAGGWFADGHTPVQSDITKLVPQSMPALRGLHRLEAVTGVSGEIDVAVRGRDVATPATVRWMANYQAALLRRYGYSATTGCARATLCPALSLTDLFSATGAGADRLTQSAIDSLLRSVPAYFTSAVLTPDRRAATLAFGIRLMPLARQQQVIDRMRAGLHPPPGVQASLTGLPVLAASADASLASGARRLEELAAGLVAVALVLLLVLRRPRRALVPVAPIVLATGWSGLLLWLLGIPLNPMSATLGTLVIAISTEFSVLLSERFHAERADGLAPAAALARTYRSTGRAVLTSGLTAIAGFGVLAVSNITMLRDFGLVTLVDLTVSLGGVLLVLPAALAWSPGDVGAWRRAPSRLRLRRRASIA